MTTATGRPTDPIRSRGWFRHGAAAVVTLALNAAMVFFLIAWTGRTRAARPAPLRAVPVHVVDIEPEEVHPTDAEEAQEPVVLEPPVEPPLPAPPQPMIPIAELSLDMPMPVEVAAASLADVPLYGAEAPGPSPMIQAVVSDPRPAGPAAKPS
ncbi:MAG: hypothetical protein WBF17_18275, partial [Phycisphaerae bacterium]